MENANIFKIHPAIGIARLGNSTTDFCLTPEKERGLPVKCDHQGRAVVNSKGQEQPIDTFKDSQGRIKRQAARFRVYVYQDENDANGHEVKIGEVVKVTNLRGELFTAKVLDIQWTVYLANKKASWYAFKELSGEHGYAPDHPLRNATITDANDRQRLIIDPGPQTVSYLQASARHAAFAQGQNPAFPQSFPPPLVPNSIDTLGELIATQQDDHNRLLVLGGYGNSGSFSTGFGQPHTENFANNDGWFDDVADGPVNASLVLKLLTSDGQPLLPGASTSLTVQVNDPAWVLTASPSFVPQLENIVTLDDVLYDLAIRTMDYNPEIYGTSYTQTGAIQRHTSSKSGTASKDWNPNYYPYFYRDIWPILRRPEGLNWVLVFDPGEGGDPHNTARGGRGNMDLSVISVPPYTGQDPTEAMENAGQREFVYRIMRKPGQENLLRAPIRPDDVYYQPLLMPLQCGDNPLSNELPSKFLRLTETQLFFLRQWADGKFINEDLEGIAPQVDKLATDGTELDKGVLWNTLGGAFCPGGEVCWIIRNPAIYAKPYRIKHGPYTPGALSQPAAVSGAETVSDLSLGLEPGDLTKYGPIPWQTDFNECNTQDIDVTYAAWNKTYPDSADNQTTFKKEVQPGVFWWPVHRPLEIFTPSPGYDGQGITAQNQAPWTRSIPENLAGDFEMVTAWSTLGFIQKVASADVPSQTIYVETERNDGSDKLPVTPKPEHKK